MFARTDGRTFVFGTGIFFMKPSYFKNINSLEELKKQYRKLAFIFHPDMGGKTENMQAINREYEYFYATYTNQTAKFKKLFQEGFWDEIPKCERCNNYMRENENSTWYCPTCEMNEWEIKEKENNKKENSPQCEKCNEYKTQNRHHKWICVYCLVESMWHPRWFEGEFHKKWFIRYEIEKINLEKIIFGIYFDSNGKQKTYKRVERWDEKNKYIHPYTSKCEKCDKYLVRGLKGEWVCTNCTIKISKDIFEKETYTGEFLFP